jgi:hypothetical protein
MTLKTRPFYLGLAIAVLLTFAPPVSASTLTEVAKLVASDAAQEDVFGLAVAVDGDTAVIGAPGNDDGGAAYVFTRSGGVWTQQAKLTPSDPTEHGSFGISVALDGDTAIVGALRTGFPSFFAGATYVFTRSGTTWTQQAKLVPDFTPVDQFDDDFGRYVALDGNTAVVGAKRDDSATNPFNNSGLAYVFTRSGTTWSQQARLAPSDLAAEDAFGFSVAVDGDTSLIGAPNGGFAYIFTRSGGIWTEQAKLTPSDTLTFGDCIRVLHCTTVALDGDTAMVGTAFDDGGSGSSVVGGSVYVFTRSGATWGQQAKLVTSDAPAFGESIALDGDTAVIGAGDFHEAAYLFTRSGTTWTQQSKLVPSDATGDDGFGSSVALDGATAVIGAIRNSGSGSAYVFSLAKDVDIDIKPGNNQNKINPRSNGKIWVAVLSDIDAHFDPLQIKIPSVRFGPDEAKATRHRVRDINKDGLGDLLLHFKIRRTGIECGDTEAVLSGVTFDKQKFRGVDSVKTVGCN